MTSPIEQSCSLSQALDFFSERWMLQIMREAFQGTTRFTDFRKALRIASDVLTTRLTALVEAGVMERREYREAGQRARTDYHLTGSGQQLALVLAALQQWGEQHLPSDVPGITFSSAAGRAVAVRFVDEDGAVLDEKDVLTK
ncbi:winged helix-turn-helix transcriptional regulator [Paractinoplanes abujensis]|uniref:DNA-binding HxlR family transcriptional regulator n=1 Tax=Paractinoplanes abujensis TaxID=882441 RepID=A0A7W7CTH0_9ACTN|nr:helix-turn-helix domain-containing protein [Actinoplanes abujensis]MBB4692676.1 DNA-binding HxlR family transcriptional regulator [Actinoplanes abujensis]